MQSSNHDDYRDGADHQARQKGPGQLALFSWVVLLEAEYQALERTRSGIGWDGYELASEGRYAKLREIRNELGPDAGIFDDLSLTHRPAEPLVDQRGAGLALQTLSGPPSIGPAPIEKGKNFGIG